MLTISKDWVVTCTEVGYGGLTFAKKDLDRVVDYVRNQKRHHSEGTLWDSLESTDGPASGAAG